MNSGVKMLAKRLYPPNLRDVAVLEIKAFSRIFNFHTFVYNFFPPTCRQMYEKLKTRLNAFTHSYIPQIW